MRLSGTLLDIERKAGNFAGDNGKEVSYDYTVLHVLAGREVVIARLPKEVDPRSLPFIVGDVVDVLVTVPKGTKVMFESAAPAVVSPLKKAV